MKLQRTTMAVLATSALILSGCSNGATTDASKAGASASSAASSSVASAAADGTYTADHPMKIVTSTSIWADLAKAVITSDNVTVTPIIDGDGIDPHSFEPSPKDAATIEDADLVIVGGAGYDAWLYQIAGKAAPTISALDIDSDEYDEHDGEDHSKEGDDHAKEGDDHAKEGDSKETENHDGDKHDSDEHTSDAEAQGHEHNHGHGHHHSHGHGEHSTDPSHNEHTWLSPKLASEVAKKLADKLTTEHPEIKADATDVVKRLDALDQRLSALPHKHIVQAHPIADQLFAGHEVHDITPDSYRDATLDEAEPSARAVADVLDTIRDGHVDMVVNTPEEATDTTRRITDEAAARNIPVVDITEIPEPGQNYFDYLEDIVQRVEKVLK